MQREIRTKIQAEAAGRQLDLWLAARFTYHSLELWREQIAAGKILCNGAIVEPDLILSKGDEVAYLPPMREEPEVDTNIAIIYEDEDLLAVNKPANLPCHPGGCFFNHTLWALLRETHPDARLINRLDRETSGVVLLAKSKAVAGQLGRQFEQREVNKEYLVLVEGEFPPEVVANGFLDSDPESEVKKKRRFRREGEGEACEMMFTCFDVRDGLSLLKVQLGTGRMHQIRATLCSLGYPVVGDKIYGVDDTIFLRFIGNDMTAEDHQRLRLPTQALHAWRLGICHPTTEEKVVFEAPAPDWRLG
ncbi:hypothetical protein BVY04_02290 [bacterium M21]|nr:hypothetical protein BVY04_02290 [bacterium M21]